MSSTKDPGADEAQKKVYNVFVVFMIDVKKMRRVGKEKEEEGNVELKQGR